MKKAIIFDWSGTLSNNIICFRTVCNKIFSDYNHKQITIREIKSNFTIPYMKFWNAFLPDLTKKKQCELYEKYIHQAGEPKLYPNVKQIIKFLHKKGYAIFIVSSDPVSKLNKEMNSSGLNKYICQIIGQVYHKEKAIKKIIIDYQLSIHNTWYIGDTSGDIEAGKKAGVKTIGISWGFQTKKLLSQSKPFYLIDTITQLKKYCN